jgi:hypothetical protein
VGESPVRISSSKHDELDKQVNAGFRGKWVNPGNIGKAEAEIVALWNEEHPDDLILVED